MFLVCNRRAAVVRLAWRQRLTPGEKGEASRNKDWPSTANPREQQHGCGPCRRGKLEQARQATAFCTWKPSRVREVKGAQRSAFSRPSGSGARSSPARRATPECAPYGSSLPSPTPLTTAKMPVLVPPAEGGPGASCATARSKSAPRCCVSPVVGDGRRAVWCVGRSGRPGAARLPAAPLGPTGR